MNEKIKQQWVDALLSGDYEQGKDRLKEKTGDKYCCLGVLTHILDPEAPELEDKLSLPGRIAEKAGIECRGERFNPGAQYEVSVMVEGFQYDLTRENDRKHATFEDIAMLIKDADEIFIYGG